MDFCQLSEVADFLSRFLSPSILTVIEAQRRSSRLGHLQIGALSFAFLEFGAPVRLEVDVKTDQFTMMSCFAGAANLKIDEIPVHLKAGRGVFARPCQSIIGTCSSDCVWLIMKIDPKIGVARGLVDFQKGLVNLEKSAWFEQIQLILSSPDFIDAVAKQQDVADQMETLLLSLIKSAWPLDAFEGLSKVVSSDVRRAEIFIKKHATEPISLNDIAEISGVSARALQTNFMRFRHISPMQYLRDVRLRNAHDRLLEYGARSVSEVAFESGFNHLGRFALIYRERFGETPSETLRRRIKPSRAAWGMSRTANVMERTFEAA